MVSSAGSPYAVKDYYNVNPDLAVDPAKRLEEFDALIEKGRSTTVEAEREAAYAEAQELMLTELPYIIAFYEDVLTASRDYVQGYTINPINRYFYLENVWLNE